MINVELKYGVRRHGSKIETEYHVTNVDEYILERPESDQLIYMVQVISDELDIPKEDIKYLGAKQI